MDRRNFLKMIAASGVSLGLAKRARADEPYTGTFYVMVNADGGWDPTSLCDPKGTLPEQVGVPGVAVNRNYLATDIAEVGGIRYAPLGNNQAFFERFASRLLVVNGIDTSTNGHDTGSKHVWSGFLSGRYPSFAALVAGSLARDLPMSFITNGGYDTTRGLVPPARSVSITPLTRMAKPNRGTPSDDASFLHHDDAMVRIAQAQDARLERQLQHEDLPRRRWALDLLGSARSGRDDIARLQQYLPATLDTNGNVLRRQAQIAVAAYRAGLAVSVNMSVGGFDTHNNHDVGQVSAMTRYLSGVDFLMTEIENGGIADRTVVVMGSDFGRTPNYNAGQGKDHWSITSMMFMGPGITGGRVVGATDARHKPLTVNPTTLLPDPAGIKLRPVHIHRALRAHAGVSDSEGARRFPLGGEDLPLFT